MRGLLVSWMLVGAGALAAWGGQEPDFSKVEIKATKVSGPLPSMPTPPLAKRAAD
jgi:hypothetical protein